MDQNTLALGGLLIAILSLIATLVAPRLVGKARLGVGTRDVSRLGGENRMSRVQVQVALDDKLIQEPVFLWHVAIENTGSKDITKNEFVDPIQLSMGNEIEILTAELEAPDGVKPQWEIRDGMGELQWSILKPKEIIHAKIVGRALSLGLTNKSVSSAVTSIARLRDVRLGASWRRHAPLVSALIGAALMSTIFAAASFLSASEPIYRWVYAAKNGNQYSVGEVRKIDLLTLSGYRRGLAICHVKDGVMNSNSCRSVSAETAQKLISVSKRGRVSSTIATETLLFLAGTVAAGVAVGTGLILTGFPQALRRAVRRMAS